MADPVTIVAGATFCISDELGDIGGSETGGLWDTDVRFLSRLALTIGGRRPLLLSSGAVGYARALFYLRSPAAGSPAPDTLLISRDRVVGAGMDERLRIRNTTATAVAFALELELAADFADVFTVKSRDAAGGGSDPVMRLAEADPQGHRLVFEDSAPGYASTIDLSRLGAVDGARVGFAVELAPRAEWSLTISVRPLQPTSPRVPEPAPAPTAPRIETTQPGVQLTLDRSLGDLAALELRTGPLAGVTAAGAPWFMTVFGRDTIITCLQTMLLGPDRARRSLRVLAELQATRDDPETEAEPGKIIHELRQGKAAAAWFARYYGSVDATPLFLILLSELWRWTADGQAVQELREPALRALRWIDEYGDRDGDGFVEYARRGTRGLDNQSWKDSGDSQRFADGRLARPPIAPCEVQGYVYDAKRRTAELAREVWCDPNLAGRLEHEADALRRRFNEEFWIAEREGYYALALDGDKQPVDSLCSNIGHLLWSGIVPADRVEPVVDQLLGDTLWTGWGIRTMSSADAGYNPIGYHVGTVWPHDTSLVAAGLARYGRRAELERVARAMLEAADQLDHQLPEVFAGLAREEAPFPVAYPTACRPQAWAAAAPVLLLQLVLGLTPDPRARALTSTADETPSWVGDLDLRGVRACGATWDIRAHDGTTQIERRQT